jgi:tetratricopeptide (TPR) repeat protein
VGNTTGDYDEAVRLSQRSLEIRPDYPGYLDTLGRCYYAKGDFENAIKHQSQAVKLDPHSGQIRRQLEFFKKEQAARGGKSE